MIESLEEVKKRQINLAAKEIFVHKYRVRKGFGGVSVLQELATFGNGTKLAWVDTPYERAPRALTTEIKG